MDLSLQHAVEKTFLVAQPVQPVALTVRIYSTEERRLHTTCLETAKEAMESFGLFE